MIAPSSPSPDITGFHDPATGTLSYLIVDRPSRRAAIVDPVLDYQPAAGRVSTASAERLVAAAEGLGVDWIIETHAHADHLSAAAFLRERLGARIVTGTLITQVQETWKRIYHLGPDFVADGSQFDRLMRDGEHLTLGETPLTFWHTPGHTPSCMMVLVGAEDAPTAVFLGDTLFMPDAGSARADFPGGDARELYRSVRRVLALPPATPLYVCHDYLPEGRPLAFVATVAEHRRANIHLRDGIGEDDFVVMRTARDRTLGTPALLLPALQVNIRAGALPPPEANGTAYLKIPLNRL